MINMIMKLVPLNPTDNAFQHTHLKVSFDASFEQVSTNMPGIATQQEMQDIDMTRKYLGLCSKVEFMGLLVPCTSKANLKEGISTQVFEIMYGTLLDMHIQTMGYQPAPLPTEGKSIKDGKEKDTKARTPKESN